MTSNLWSDDVGSDIWNAYLGGAGEPITQQSIFAAQFFQAVTGTTKMDPAAADAMVTGHSLGGGLAGFIAGIYGQDAYIYDNMAFENAASAAYAYGQMIGSPLADLFYNGSPSSAPDFSNIHAYAVMGEFLHLDRLLQTTDVTDIDSNGGLRDPVAQLHSISLLVNLQFAKDNSHIDWAFIGPDLLDAMFSDDVGLASGFEGAGTNGVSGSAGKMLAAMACLCGVKLPHDSHRRPPMGMWSLPQHRVLRP